MDQVADFAADHQFDDAIAQAIDWRKRTGGQIVGYMGSDVPIEIILALGMLPSRVHVSRFAMEKVARCREMGDSDMVAVMANTLLDGSHDFIDQLVFGNSPAVNVALFHFLRERRRGRIEPDVPRLIFHEMHHGGGLPVEAFNLESCRRLAMALAPDRAPIGKAALVEALACVERGRAAIGALGAMRRSDPPAISGEMAMTLIGQWWRNPLLGVECPEPAPNSRRRIFYCGEAMAHLPYYRAIEAAGCTIVAEDHDWGEHVATRPVSAGGDVLKSIADSYGAFPARSARSPMRDYIAAAFERVTSAGAEGVILCGNAEDQAFAWNVPGLRSVLASVNVPILDLGPQPVVDPDFEDVTATVRDWLDAIRGERP